MKSRMQYRFYFPFLISIRANESQRWVGYLRETQVRVPRIKINGLTGYWCLNEGDVLQNTLSYGSPSLREHNMGNLFVPAVPSGIAEWFHDMMHVIL